MGLVRNGQLTDEKYRYVFLLRISFLHVGQDSAKLKPLCFKSFPSTVNRFIDSNIVRSKKL